MGLKPVRINEKVKFGNLAEKMKRIQSELGDKCVFIIAVDDNVLEILRIEVLDKNDKSDGSEAEDGKMEGKAGKDKVKPRMALDGGISYIG